MRMKEANFETALRRALEQKPGLSQASEAALFARAEELLSSRRELISARNADARRMSQARASALLASRQTHLAHDRASRDSPERTRSRGYVGKLRACFRGA